MNDEHLRRLLDAPGPFVSVYLNTDPAVEDAAHRVDVRWRNLRDDLAGQGAPEAALDAIGEAVGGAHTEGATLAVIANGSGALHVSHHPDPVKTDVARVSPLPYLGPLIEWRQETPNHVVVLADRTGADVVAFRYDRDDLERTVQSDDSAPVHNARAGGWSERRYEERVHNTWESNAKEVAEQVARIVDASDARLVVLAGDTRAVTLLKDHLPSPVQPLIREAAGSRARDGSDDVLATAVTRLVATVVAEDTVELLNEFREEKGQQDRAADGPEPTLQALTAAQVATLLVHDDPDDERTAYFGPEPIPVSTNPQTLRDLGVAEPRHGRLVEVAIRAALGSGADVRIVPGAGGPAGGIGAVLRFTSDTQPLNS